MDVLGTLSAARPRLRPAELRVAMAILEDPETAAVATVAALAVKLPTVIAAGAGVLSITTLPGASSSVAATQP